MSTHIGDAWRAAGLLPIAMPFSVRNSTAPGPGRIRDFRHRLLSRLIGVNTRIASPSGASAGVGFAVPVNTVSRVVPQIIETGEYTPPQLGIRMDDGRPACW